MAKRKCQVSLVIKYESKQVALLMALTLVLCCEILDIISQRRVNNKDANLTVRISLIYSYFLPINTDITRTVPVCDALGVRIKIKITYLI